MAMGRIFRFPGATHVHVPTQDNKDDGTGETQPAIVAIVTVFAKRSR